MEKRRDIKKERKKEQVREKTNFKYLGMIDLKDMIKKRKIDIQT